mmetsp:Transcript_31190/g.75387  ORF Transcript_31190/g.75387 Transcript_31190/m.75387 type:complete len:339 (-) Transcript_31190:1206-2222(-)
MVQNTCLIATATRTTGRGGRMMSVNAAVHTLLVSAIVLVVFHLPLRSTSFQLGNVFKAFTPQPTGGKIKVGGAQRGDVIDARTKLLRTISETKNGKDASVETQRQVLDLVEFLEKSSSSSPRRSVDDIVRLVDGTWFLDYTQPIEIEGGEEEVVVTIDDGEEGSSSLPPSSYKVSSKSLTKAGGQVNFLGLTTVDVSGGNGDNESSSSSSSNGSDDTSNKPSTTTQSIDVKNQRITNRVTKSGFVSTIQVAGSYDVDEELLSSSTSSPSFRIIVSFDTCLVELLGGKVTLDLGFLFDLRALTQNGSKVGGWLETTYVDDKIRIGRGNRGSLFILSREN